ncbi:MAG: hypothetical protein AAF621_01945, partial [Pseudomonadota bacterium]
MTYPDLKLRLCALGAGSLIISGYILTVNYNISQKLTFETILDTSLYEANISLLEADIDQISDNEDDFLELKDIYDHIEEEAQHHEASDKPDTYAEDILLAQKKARDDLAKLSAIGRAKIHLRPKAETYNIEESLTQEVQAENYFALHKPKTELDKLYILPIDDAILRNDVQRDQQKQNFKE